ncbi:hypothetical protein D3C75_847340 [compost metagenome]
MFGHGQRGFGFADTRGADQQEHPQRLLWVTQARVRGLERFSDLLDGCVLTANARLDVVGQRQHPTRTITQHFTQRHASPVGHHLGDGVRVDFSEQQRHVTLQRSQSLAGLIQLDLTYGHRRQHFANFAFDWCWQVFFFQGQLLASVQNAYRRITLGQPAGMQRRTVAFNVRLLGGDVCQALIFHRETVGTVALKRSQLASQTG